MKEGFAMSLSSYFEIPVTDMNRAISFYETVFDVDVSRSVVDGVELAILSIDGVASGALARGETYVPSVDGTRVYLSVDAIQPTMRTVLESGGRELYPATSIGDLGWVAEFEDTEGNRVALTASLLASPTTRKPGIAPDPE
jgi:uncharacterized protein